MSENIAYLLVTASTILFACQFLFQKKYGESEGEGLRASVTLALLSSIVRIILVVILYGVSGYSFTLYGFVCSFFAAVSYCCVILFSAGALKYANMAKYSVYMMLGGMVLPFAAGTAFFSEPLTFGQICRTFTCGCGDMLFKSKGRNKNPRRSEVLYRSFYMQRHERSYLKIQPEFTGRAVCLVVHAFDGGLVGCHLRCLSGW